MNETVLLDVRRLAADVMKKTIDEVPADGTRDSVSGWDSMAHVNLVLAIEQHFDVQFKPEEMLEMLSIELTAMLVEEKLAARGTRRCRRPTTARSAADVTFVRSITTVRAAWSATITSPPVTWRTSGAAAAAPAGTT